MRVCFQHCDSIGLRHRKLHPVPCSHIQRKHLRVHLCRTNRLVPHQALQHLQRNTSIQHMHRVGMAESMWGNRTENVTPSAAAASTASFSQVRTVRSVIPQMRAFSILPVRLFLRSSGIFSVATIICSWLTYCVSDREPGDAPDCQQGHGLPFWSLFQSVV